MKHQWGRTPNGVRCKVCHQPKQAGAPPCFVHPSDCVCGARARRIGHLTKCPAAPWNKAAQP